MKHGATLRNPAIGTTLAASDSARARRKELDAVRLAGGRAGVVRTIEDLEALVAGIEPVQLGTTMNKLRSRKERSSKE